MNKEELQKKRLKDKERRNREKQKQNNNSSIDIKTLLKYFAIWKIFRFNFMKIGDIILGGMVIISIIFLYLIVN